MEFVLATGNAHKVAEMRTLLGRWGHTCISQKEAGINLAPDENGTSFEENALIKARAIAALANKPVLADDSGLCVDALNGAPGIYSARFAGENAGDGENNKKLLKLLEGCTAEKRTAQFVCVLALVMPNGKELAVCGECKGTIGFEEDGNGGFGYDPLFYVNGQSFASMGEDEKNKISHRANAVEKLAEAIEKDEEFLGQ